MSLIEREIKADKLYISNKTSKMAIEQNGQIVSDENKVWEIISENRIPIKVQFEITEKCNFNCYYCYAKSLRGRKDLSTEEIKKIIDILDEIGIVFLELTGGEPLARPDFLEILKYINSKNFIISMITNGSMLTKEIVEELEKGSVDVIRVSLLAPTEELCDDLTKLKGSFNKTIEAVKYLKESNLRFYVSSILTNKNIQLYEEYKKLEKEMEKEISYGIDVGPSFTGYEDVEQYGLTFDDIESIKLFINKESYENIPELVCSAGKSKFAIDNQGNLLPCLKVRRPFGNILTEDFYEMWQSKKLENIMNEELVRDSKCLKCEKKNYCGAYCPAEYKLYKDDEVRCRTADIINRLIEC